MEAHLRGVLVEALAARAGIDGLGAREHGGVPMRAAGSCPISVPVCAPKISAAARDIAGTEALDRAADELLWQLERIAHTAVGAKQLRAALESKVPGTHGCFAWQKL